MGRPMDVSQHNKAAWDRRVAAGNRWTLPVTPEAIAQARQGIFEILLTPERPIPRDWFPPLQGTRVLALASGGGQQGPILAAAGAVVTVFDNSPRQLAQDRLVADREGLSLETVEGDMMDLSRYAAETFDLIVHPVSNCFVPDVRRVWQEAARVLRPGGVMLAGFCNPVLFATDPTLEAQGILQVTQSIPYSDLGRERTDEPLAFGHSLEDLIGGQIDAGFHITGFYEARGDAEKFPLCKYMATFIATRAVKP